MTQVLAAAGAAVGLVTVDGPGAGGSVWSAVEPYALNAAAGAALGLVVAAAVVLAWRSRSPVPGAARPRREAIPERVRHEVWRRDRGTCVQCGSRARLEFDHIIPVSRGGSSTPRNLELRCEPCNRRKGARI
jgi:5-methylcytosine-specific restriction endonuclease McrA